MHAIDATIQKNLTLLTYQPRMGGYGQQTKDARKIVTARDIQI
jgi:hypothetical protein